MSTLKQAWWKFKPNNDSNYCSEYLRWLIKLNMMSAYSMHRNKSSKIIGTFDVADRNIINEWIGNNRIGSSFEVNMII